MSDNNEDKPKIDSATGIAFVMAATPLVQQVVDAATAIFAARDDGASSEKHE